MNWGYRIKAITVVLQITEHGALPCTSTKINLVIKNIITIFVENKNSYSA